MKNQNTIDLQIIANAKEATNGLKSMSGAMSSLGSTTGSAFSTIGTVFSSVLGTLKTLANTITKLGTTIFSFTKKSIEASETLNLFNTVFENIQQNGETTFSELGLKATQFQNTLAEQLSVNKYETMKYQALYDSLAKNMGVNDDKAEVMSQGMTKLMYDLSSLYNEDDIGKVSEAIKSSIYSGNVRPLKNYGVDVTQNALANTLENLGITDRSISDMSQAEKQLLRYKTALDQTKVAQKDFAETINSPANQLKVLKEQFEQLQIAIGSLFTGLFGQVLPIINGIIMAIKEMVKALASFFGIEIQDYKEHSAIADIGNDVDDYGDSAEKAAQKVKELKRQTLGFDQINNLTTPSSSGSSSGSGYGTSGGIDQRLLDAIYDYDNGMEQVKNKANEIRDRIMGWLGFTKEIDEQTGEISYKYKYQEGLIKKLVGPAQDLKDILEPISKFTFKGALDFYKYFLQPLANWTLNKALPQLVESVKKFVEKVDWDKLNRSLERFWKALEPFAEAVGEGLLWFYDRVLVPLGSWQVNTLLTGFLDTLSGCLETLHGVIEPAKKYYEFLWEYFLAPLGEWGGTLINDALQLLNEKLADLGVWVKEHPNVMDFLGEMFTVISVMASPLLLTVGAIELFTAGLEKLGVWLDKHPKLQQTLEGIGKGFKFIWDNWPGNKLAQAFKDLATDIGKALDKLEKLLEKLKEYSSLQGHSGGGSSGGGGRVGTGLATGGVYQNGSWRPVTQYASGGLPSTGQMFVAREAGPELVGRLGNNTAVMNNNQIVASVSAGVAKAVAGVMGSGGSSIEVHVHTDEGTVIDRINKITRRTGNCPIEL